MTERKKKKFAFVYDIVTCNGWQQFIVEAYDLEDAKRRMEDGDCEFDCEDMEVTHLSDSAQIYSEDGTWIKDVTWISKR